MFQYELQKDQVKPLMIHIYMFCGLNYEQSIRQRFSIIRELDGLKQ